MRKKEYKLHNKIAQSIIELSLLGAALLGIIGLLIRYSIGLSDAQDVQLRAMRAAMKLSAGEAMVSDLDFLRDHPSFHSYPPTTNFSGSKKEGHRKTATVLWVEDKPAVEGGEKYGASSVTPAISFGSGTLTNLLQYPLHYGDPSQIPYLDMYINGKHFTFTTFGYRKYNFDNCSYQGSSTGLPHCLTVAPTPDGSSGGKWYLSSPRHVAWTKIPKTDTRFCYGDNDPADHYCNFYGDGEGHYSKRFLLDPLLISGQPITDMTMRKKMQWQWYPVLLNHAAIRFFTSDPNTSVDIDYDGHEEIILEYQELQSNGMCTATFSHFDEYGDAVKEQKPKIAVNWHPNSPNWTIEQCEADYVNDGGNWVINWARVVDNEAGDLAMTYNTVDKLQGKPKPGFDQGKAKIVTTTTGSLTVDQKKIGNISKNISVQKKDTVNIIERQIQLSNNTGRFMPNYAGDVSDDVNQYSNLFCVDNPNSDKCYASDNPDVDVSCVGDFCCSEAQNQYRTCFNETTKILYIRSITGSNVGHKYKTLTPIHNAP